ncbi:alpha-N-acetylglucosaminidase-like isoform X2 [Cynara cardunculus var. scolymus]|uniref:alpha-N-acetylglucosaminidase-like isoform X2 n=1 Tax=Cynara cardunculus var. scolymus TaxID=59895 RepID=UPI000D630B30|nr:alpha-N-acetylglucosaminidase-like isoform X2 [Cynara cardunculus var. scolymus]XP_024970215.1 alpha-N-acetylglucosaminidase-like isoform X2 [Cynara cardunculus var. scolymus]XP_024970216.1 alpha-N-acetylglucosaminidase-like isoform X2 [Cynara cardunculus var. scolymus]
MSASFCAILVRIRGVTGVELLTGLHWYLKNLCGAHISWDKTGGSQLSSVPKAGSLPRVQDDGLLIQRPVPWNYYQNAVTSSYTFAWWDWQRWEKEIDWMALQGINMPLAFTGQEAIWQKVFENFNISSSDLNDFFGGPAFLAWSRMANLHGWGGPLPQSWLDQQLAMQKKILARMYELGMTPVLPAFSGNVPAALKNVYPSAKITHLGNWFTVDSNPKWCCTYLLDASDPLFIEIGKAFIQQQIKEYGRSSHIYNCDTFDENTPPTDDPQYISSLAAAIFKGMQSGDDDAVWLMQGWLFAYDPYWRPPQMQALLHSVPIGKMIVLDLYAEVNPIWTTSNQFYGVPYIWCMLHNFAGNVEMYGVLDSVGSGPIEARISKNSTMVGVGMSMEGIEQNPVVYDLMSEMAFQHKKIDVKKWVDSYSTRRYGKFVPSVQEAWSILYHTVYNCTDGAYDKNRDVIVAFPDVDPALLSKPQIAGRRYLRSSNPLLKWNYLKDTDEPFDKPHLWYSTSEVIRALQLFIEGGNELSGSNTYRYDLVDLTRQALAKYANDLFLDVIKSYELHDDHGVAHLSEKFLDLVDDMDTLLACHEGFLLGPWLESSKQLAIDNEQEKQYEWNARTQITMWFDNTAEEASLLRDYGNKYWSGLLRDYYGPRAAIYFKYLRESLSKGEVFDLKSWRREWIELTNGWQNGRDVYPVKSEGDAHNTSRWLFDVYLRGSGLNDH